MEWWHPVLGGVTLAAAVGVGKWAVNSIVSGVVKDLDKKLGLEGIRKNINPGAAGWPNGSTTLPETLQTLYSRQGDAHERLKAIEGRNTPARLEALEEGMKWLIRERGGLPS